MDNKLKEKIKWYEDSYKTYLEYGTPKILRVDMRSGKNFTKHLQKPFDRIFSQCMIQTMIHLCETIPGAKIGYTQSDEISIIIRDLNKENQPTVFFNNSLTKIISNVASMTTIFFNISWEKAVLNFCAENNIDIEEARRDIDKYEVLKPYFDMHLCGMFDCRYFEVPSIEEVKNYLQFRQEDCNRNSINQVARFYFSHSSLEGVNSTDKVKMLEDKGIKLNQFPSKYLKGQICYKIPEVRNGVDRFKWKDEIAPNFYNNLLFVEMLYNN